MPNGIYAFSWQPGACPLRVFKSFPDPKHRNIDPTTTYDMDAGNNPNTSSNMEGEDVGGPLFGEIVFTIIPSEDLNLRHAEAVCALPSMDVLRCY